MYPSQLPVKMIFNKTEIWNIDRNHQTRPNQSKPVKLGNCKMLKLQTTKQAVLLLNTATLVS